MKLSFSDGEYEFWIAHNKEDTQQLVLRTSSSKKSKNKTPKARMKNLLLELIEMRAPATAIQYYTNLKCFRKATKVEVCTWLAIHPNDLFDLLTFNEII